MAAISFLQRFLGLNCGFIHGHRRNALVRVVDSLMNGARLNLSALGRGLGGGGRTKNKIKLVDRLLGNERLHRERSDIYRQLAHWALSERSRPVIAVDWSDFGGGNDYQLLKAAVAIEGRALTVYEEVHPVRGVSRARAERLFLVHLAEVVPASCRPIIVTDAGFHGPWFRQVRALGWDYLGRLRNALRVRLPGREEWCLIKELYPLAGTKAVSLGEAEVSHNSPYRGHLCLIRSYRPRRGRRRGNRPISAKWREPWLLVSSLSPHDATPATVVKLYAKRMQIEETFRDLKETRSSFALVFARCRTIARRQVLLLIATLAMFALWLLGLAARALGWQRHFQANTERRWPVLSAIFLGRAVHQDPRYELPEEAIDVAAQLLQLSVQELRHCE